MVAFKLGEVDEAASWLQQALTLADEIGLPFMQAHILGNLARVAVTKGDQPTAKRHLKRGLQIGLNVDNIVSPNAIPVSVAELRIVQGKGLKVAAWSTLAAHHPEAEHHDRVQAQRVLADLREKLPSSALEAAIQQGQELELEEPAREVLAGP